MTIQEGLGAGLKFNAAASNPEYGLGSNEQPVQEAFARYLHAGDVFYDVGANVGFFTVIGAKLVGSGGQVHAFEPVPENAAAVRHNCELNGMKQVTVWETAVSDRSGMGQLQLAQYSGGASLSVAAPPPDYKETVSVDLITLDEFLEEKKAAPPSLVKIDVEGAEINVLKGMVNLIEKHKPIIIFEIDDGEVAAFQKKKTICTDFLQNMGYTIELLPDSYPHAGWIVENYVALPA
ncbi:MAG: FkbM family methyltransferase [Ardenticatenaceae bacterium]|nr:FkbM family methyltransferase [Anaerolineales bacterium]MCB8982732.1 FkbM family methyltransferase [Ardenticatenaceae bacterium]